MYIIPKFAESPILTRICEQWSVKHSIRNWLHVVKWMQCKCIPVDTFSQLTKPMYCNTELLNEIDELDIQNTVLAISNMCSMQFTFGDKSRRNIPLSIGLTSMSFQSYFSTVWRINYITKSYEIKFISNLIWQWVKCSSTSEPWTCFWFLFFLVLPLAQMKRKFIQQTQRSESSFI